MSVQNGQPVNAAINNAANMSRLVDTSTSGKVDVNNTTDSTSSITGALHTTGGLGIEKSASVGANLAVTGITSLAGVLNSNGIVNTGNINSGSGTVTADTMIAASSMTSNSGGFQVLNATTATFTNATSGSLIVTANQSVGGTSTVAGLVSANSGLNVLGSTALTGSLSVSTTASLTGNTTIGGLLSVAGATNLNGGANVTGTTTLTGPLNVTGDTAITGNQTVTGNQVITGTLIVQGSTTTLNSNTLDVTDSNITVNKSGNDATSEGSGLTVDRTGAKGSLIYATAAASKWKIGNLGSEIEVVNTTSTQTLTGKTLTGNTALNFVNGAATITLPITTQTLATLSGTETLISKTMSGASNTFTNIPLTTAVTGSLPIANGGTNAITANAGLNNLLPTQTGNAAKALITDGTNTSWGTVASTGGTGSGAVNFVTNPDAELGVTGWAVDSFAAATRPSGALTGVSTGVTFTQSATSPLAGTNSFLYSKDAVNRQGRVVYTGLTITPAYFAKVLSVTADYQVASGTFVAGSSGVDSDVIFYLWDVTNSTFIEPSSFKLLSNSTTLSDKFQATFQTSATGTSYRLMMYVASTAAVAYALRFDNISVSPSVYVYGSPKTDSGSISYTATGSWITNSTYTNKLYRDGDRLKGAIYVALAGAPTSASLTINLPYTIDTTKLAGGTAVQQDLGEATILTSSGTTGYFGKLRYNSTTSLTVIAAATGGTYAPVTQIYPATFGNTDSVSCIIDVPIVGWSSSVQMSDAADTRILLAKYRFTSATTASPTQPFNFNTIVSDTHAAVTTSSTAWRFSATSAGKYLVFVTHIAGAMSQTTYLYKNGVQGDYYFTSPFTAGNGGLSGSQEIDLLAGDYIDVRPDSSGSFASGNIVITKLAGPSAFAASESVYASFSTSAGQAIGTSATIVNFDTRSEDSTGSVTTGAAWKFIAQIQGEYEISAANHHTAQSTTLIMEAYKNGSSYRRIGQLPIATTGSLVTGGTLVRMIAGDYLQIALTAGMATTLIAIGSLNYVNIKRVGN